MRSKSRRGLLFGTTSSCLLAAYAMWLRPCLLTWGATGDEISGHYPGDDLVRIPDGGATMATTLPAPPDSVWPWLVQMGGDRGGWYSWDYLDNGRRPSSDRIVPDWQTIEVGQHLLTSPDGPSRFVAAIVEENRTLVLRGDYSKNIDGIWGFHLRPAPPGSTRLVVRTRNRGRPRWVMRLVQLIWSEPVHFVMQTRQFKNLRDRVSAPTSQRLPGNRTASG